MKKLLTLVAVSALVGPVGVAQAGVTPSPEDSKNAAKYCKQMRTSSGENFRAWVDNLVDGKVTAKNAYGKCVSHFAKDEANERSSARKQAVTDCKAEREAATTDAQKAAFADKYDAPNSNSAYGKCVSSKAKANKAEADEKDQERVNAARECRAERGTSAESRAAFARAHRNFGHCVSMKARAKSQQS